MVVGELRWNFKKIQKRNGFFSYSFSFRIPAGTETLNSEVGYVTLNNNRPVLTVYRYYRVPASDGNLYKVYVEANEAGMHWIVEGNKLIAEEFKLKDLTDRDKLFIA